MPCEASFQRPCDEFFLNSYGVNIGTVFARGIKHNKPGAFPIRKAREKWHVLRVGNVCLRTFRDTKPFRKVIQNFSGYFSLFFLVNDFPLL